MSFKTGDIITAHVHGRPYNHMGIVVVEPDGDVRIFHNTPSQKNEVGGSVVEDSITDFQVTRTILKIESSDLKADYIIAKSIELQKKKFNLIFFNCEHFVFLLLNGKKESPQMRKLYTVSGVMIYSANKLKLI